MGKRGSILHILSGDLWGGAEAQILLQLDALRALGLDVRALIFNEGQVLERVASLKIPCTVTDERRGFFEWLKVGLEAIVRADPAVIVSHGYKEALLGAVGARRVGAPLITTFHGAPEVHAGAAAFKARLNGLLHCFIARFVARRIVTVSNALAEELGFGSLDKLRVVFNVTAARPDPAEPSMDELQHPAVLIVGRLVRVKRVDAAIRAFAGYREAGGTGMLYIVGDGPERQELEKLAADLTTDNSIRFLGFRRDSAALISRADLLLISSEREGIPTVLLEAALAGTPVLSTPLPGVKEALAQLPGYPVLFSSDRSADSLRDCLLPALSLRRADDRSIRTALLDHFSPPAAAQKLAAIYRELASDL